MYDDIIPTIETTFHASNFQWFQPKPAQSYIGLRRFGAGDRIQTWSIVDGIATKAGRERILTGAVTLVTFAVSIFITLML